MCKTVRSFGSHTRLGDALVHTYLNTSVSMVSTQTGINS